MQNDIIANLNCGEDTEMNTTYLRIYQAWKNKEKPLLELMSEYNISERVIRLIITNVKLHHQKLADTPLNRAMYSLLCKKHTIKDIAERFLMSEESVCRRVSYIAKIRGADIQAIKKRANDEANRVAMVATLLDFPEITHPEVQVGDNVLIENKISDRFLNGEENFTMTRAKVIAVNLKDEGIPFAKVAFQGHFGTVFNLVHLGMIKEILPKPESKDKTLA